MLIRLPVENIMSHFMQNLFNVTFTLLLCHLSELKQRVLNMSSL